MKIIDIRNEQEIMNVLQSGRIVEGRLALVKDSSRHSHIEFVAYNRSRKRSQERVLRYLEHGWVKESAQRIKVFESLPKRLGPVDMIKTLRHEVTDAQDVIAFGDWEPIEFIL